MIDGIKASFDNERYLQTQSDAIMDRVARFSGKLYLEFGGKLLSDMHAARVLPGYDPDVKIKLLQRLKDVIDIVYCIRAKDIEAGRIRGDFGLTYDAASLRTFDDLEDFGFSVSAVIINRYRGEKSATRFLNFLESRGIRVYTQPEIDGYPADVDKIVSDEGYGQCPFIETTRPLVIVTGAGPGSGKMATGLAQVYHHQSRGQQAGFAKFETFPVWNLPLDHPLNLAYEAAVADLKDRNLVDPFHLEAYGETVINYNRDIENFSIMRAIMAQIGAQGPGAMDYRSPSEMGVNMVKAGILDDDTVRAAATREIIRRYFRYSWEHKQGLESRETVQVVERLLQQVGAKVTDYPIVPAARQAAEEAKQRGKGDRGIFCGAALELPSGEIVTGMNSTLMHAEAALLLNVIKKLGGIPKQIDLLPPSIIANVCSLKEDIQQRKTAGLNVEEILVALSIGAATNPTAGHCMQQLKLLKGCDMHSTHVVARGSENGLRLLGIVTTTDGLPVTRGFYY